MSNYIDLHSHVLCGLDDGARTAEETTAMLERLAAIGFRDVYATPHQRAAQFLPSQAAIAAAYEAASARATAAGISLLLGAENFWDEVFFARSRERQIPCYTGGKAFLVEISPQQTPSRFEEHLFAERARGLLPVLAHPERYGDLCDDRERLNQVRRTAALVVDLCAIDGAHGRRPARAARRLVEAGLAHAVATDVHSPSDVDRAAAGILWIRKSLGEAAAERLLSEHPRRILQGELPE